MDDTDQPKDIRKAEELDSAGVEIFLSDSIAGPQGNMALGQFPSGDSHLT